MIENMKEKFWMKYYAEKLFNFFNIYLKIIYLEINNFKIYLYKIKWLKQNLDIME